MDVPIENAIGAGTTLMYPIAWSLSSKACTFIDRYVLKLFLLSIAFTVRVDDSMFLDISRTDFLLQQEE